MLSDMNTGLPFSITYVTLDKKRGTGGELRTLVNATKKSANMVMAGSSQVTGTRKPNHSDNGTINIVCADGSITKVHTRLITQFNNHDVAL